MFDLNFIDVFRMVFINIIVISVEIGFVILVWVWFVFVDVFVVLIVCKFFWIIVKEIVIGCVIEFIYGICFFILIRISCKKIFLYILYFLVLSVKIFFICFVVRKSCKE